MNEFLPPALLASIINTIREAVRPAVAEALSESLPGAIRLAATPEFMTRSEAADYARVSVRTLDGWRQRGLPWSKRGGRVVIKAQELTAYVREARVDGGRRS